MLAPVYNKCLTRLHVNSGELGLSQGLQEGHDLSRAGLPCHALLGLSFLLGDRLEIQDPMGPRGPWRLKSWPHKGPHPQARGPGSRRRTARGHYADLQAPCYTQCQQRSHDHDSNWFLGFSQAARPHPMLSCAPQAPVLHSSGWALVLTPSAQSLRAAPPSAASRRALPQATLYTCSSFRANVQLQSSGILPEPPNWVPASELGRPFPLATGRGNICEKKKR